MFFLLRAAFWLTIVLALLPSGGTRPDGPKVGDAVSAAGAAISDLRHFCTREPGACQVGAQTAVLIGQRAQAGAKMLFEMFNEAHAPNATGSIPSKVVTAGTLSAADQAPPWRGGERR